MKKLSMLLFIFLSVSQFVSAQTKVDEYQKTDSDSESARLENFLFLLNQNPESKGLIVIYSGKNKERLGNILTFQAGMKRWLSVVAGEKFDDRISFLIAEGKQTLDKEFWIISKNEKLPEIKSVDFNLNNLKTKYLYAFVCLDCEPAVAGLSADVADTDLYKKTLEENADYIALIIIRPSRSEEKVYLKDAKKFASGYQKDLTKSRKINKKRITIRIEDSLSENSAATAELYIIPK